MLWRASFLAPAVPAGCAIALLALTSAPAPLLVDVTERSRATFVHQSSPTSHKYLIESMGSGVAVFDYDNDGFPDLYFVNGAALKDPMPAGVQPNKSAPEFRNRLYRNNTDGSFTDVTQTSGLQSFGYQFGVATGDYDNDGYDDLLVTGLGRNTLYHNNGNGRFTDVTAQAAVAGSGWSAGALFVDYDRDGLLDLVVSRYLTWDFSMDIWCGERKPGQRAYCHPDQFQPATNLIFHNEGHGRFRDMSELTGFSRSPGKGLGLGVNDFDRDGWPDIFVANDSVAQQLFHNLKNGKFEEVAVERGAAYDADGRAFSGMGMDFADYNNDGWPDVFVNALATQGYAMFRNVQGSFDYVSESNGVGAASMLHSGWGTGLVDFDNDGEKDLFVGQGHVMDNIQLTQPHLRYLEPPLLLRNTGDRFEELSGAVVTARKALAARGVAFGDLNNDGYMDVVINCNNSPAVILENRHPVPNHWLLLRLIGAKSNRDGIGAQIHLVSQTGQEQYALATTGSSYLSSSDKRVHFGLGKAQSAKLIEISWPSGTRQTLRNVASDQILTVQEP